MQPEVIINKSDLNLLMTEKIKDWCEGNNIRVAGILAFDKKMVDAMVQGKTITEFDPENPISVELKKIWNRVSGER